MDKFDSIFAAQMDDDTEFDTIFGGMEDGDIIDFASGITEAGEFENDFDELHQTADDATPDDIEDEVVGDETDNAPDDAEGTDEDPLIDLALGEAVEDECPDFEELHQTEDDATPKDFEDDLVGDETDNAPDDAEGTGDGPLEEAFGYYLFEDFDIIHQTEDDTNEKDLKDQVEGPETLNGAKDPEGTDDEPVVDLSDDGKDVDPDEEDIFGEFEKLEEEADELDDDAEAVDPILTDGDELPGTDDSEGEITDGEDAENEGLPEETMDEMMERLFEEAEEELAGEEEITYDDDGDIDVEDVEVDED